MPLTLCPKCNKIIHHLHDESMQNHLCEKYSHWRILVADTECPFRLMLDEKLSDGSIYMCSRRKDPEDNPYCSFTNCRIKEE